MDRHKAVVNFTGHSSYLVGLERTILLIILSSLCIHYHIVYADPQQQQQSSQRTTGQQVPSSTGGNGVPATKPASSASRPNGLGTSVSGINPFLQAALAALPKQTQTALKNRTPNTGGLLVGGGPKLTSAIQTINDQPAVTVVDYATLSDEILRKNTVNLVYFNANFNSCRNCYRLFNIWQDLASDIKWWRPLVRLFMINCSDEDNIDVCRRAGATQFPQVKFYWIMSNSLEQDGQRLRVLGKSVHAMRHLIMDKIVESYTEHNKILEQRIAQQRNSLSPSSTTSSSPLAQILPFINSLFGSSSATSSSSSQSTPASSAPAGGLGGIISALTSGKGGFNLAGLLGGAAGGAGGAGGASGGLNQIVSALMGANSMRQRLSVQPMPSNWPELNQIVVGESQRLLEMPQLYSKGVGVLLIMETQEFLYTGLEIIFDLSVYSNQTYVARVKDDRSRLVQSLTKRQDVKAPALVYVNEQRQPQLIMSASKYTNDEDLRKAFVKGFERRQIKYPVKRVWSTNLAARSAYNASELSQEDEETVSRSSQVYMNDLVNAIRASLMEQVFRHSDLSDDQHTALVKYIYALINYFPFSDSNSLKFFKRLHAWLQNQVSPVDTAEYKKQFKDVDDYFPAREWVACKSLGNSKAIPAKGKGPGLFENPAQFGKVVSNITKLFRGQQKQIINLRNLFSSFTSNVSPVLLSNQQQAMKLLDTVKESTGSSTSTTSTTTTTTTSKPKKSQRGNNDSGESSIERIIKGLTSGALGSDSSILKLISNALTGGESGGADKSKFKFAREFHCGVWRLAHVTVVNEYIKDSPRKDVKHIVLHSLYQYMLHFYACSTCGNRVSDVSGESRLNLDDYLLDQGDSVMLLWRMHNRVNKRLESEIRPGSPPKQQFPSESLCNKCRVQRNSQNDLLTQSIDWYDKQVLNFLVHHYRPQSILKGTSDDGDSSAAAPSATIFVSHAQNALGLVQYWTMVLSTCLLVYHSRVVYQYS